MGDHGLKHRVLLNKHKKLGKEAAKKVKTGEMTTDQLKQAYADAEADECADAFKQGYNEGQ